MPGFHSTEPTMFTEEYQSGFLKQYCKLIESKEYTMGNTFGTLPISELRKFFGG